MQTASTAAARRGQRQRPVRMPGCCYSPAQTVFGRLTCGVQGWPAASFPMRCSRLCEVKPLQSLEDHRRSFRGARDPCVSPGPGCSAQACAPLFLGRTEKRNHSGNPPSTYRARTGSFPGDGATEYARYLRENLSAAAIRIGARGAKAPNHHSAGK